MYKTCFIQVNLSILSHTFKISHAASSYTVFAYLFIFIPAFGAL